MAYWQLVGLLTGIVLASTQSDTKSCDPSYPDLCIPEHPSDLDCGDLGINDFRALQPDPHGFDRDGIGCETYS